MKISQFLKIAETQKLQNSLKSKINTQLTNVTKGMQPNIPWDKIENVLEKNGILALQEDKTKWKGFFSGKEGNAKIDLAPISSKKENGTYDPYKNSMLIMTWYKHHTGKYEIVIYLS